MTIKELKHFVKNNLPIFALLLTVILTVYANSLFNDFVSADDLAGYVNNQNLASTRFLSENFTLLTLYYFLFKVTAGNSAFALHLGSLSLHIANVFLAYTFLRLTFNKKTALYGSLLFSIHPAVSEAVLWISGVGYLHTGLVTLICLNLYALYKKFGTRVPLFISYFFFTAAIFLYENSWLLIIPFLIATIEVFIYERKVTVRSLLAAGPYLLIGGLSFALIFYSMQGERIYTLETDYSMNAAGKTPWLNRLPFSLYMLFQLLILPVNLALFHEGNAIAAEHYVAMVILLLSFIPAIIYLKNKHRIAAGLLLLIVFSVLPIFSPKQIAFFIAERYMYISALFFSAALAIVIQKLPKILKWRGAALTFLLLFVAFYGVRTFVRSYDWRNSRSLWESNARISPNSARIYNNLGDAYANEFNFEASINSFKKAIELNPNYTDAIHNLGNIYIETRQYDLAKKQYEKALELDPEYVGAPIAREILSKIAELEATESSPASQ